MNDKLSMNDLGRLSSEEFKLAQKQPLIIVLDNIRSLNNVGSAFRTGDAFLIEAIYLCGVTGTPPNKEIEKMLSILDSLNNGDNNDRGSSGNKRI